VPQAIRALSAVLSALALKSVLDSVATLPVAQTSSAVAVIFIAIAARVVTGVFEEGENQLVLDFFF
jgi:hypothetical protein